MTSVTCNLWYSHLQWPDGVGSFRGTRRSSPGPRATRLLVRTNEIRHNLVDLLVLLLRALILRRGYFNRGHGYLDWEEEGRLENGRGSWEYAPEPVLDCKTRRGVDVYPSKSETRQTRVLIAPHVVRRGEPRLERIVRMSKERINLILWLSIGLSITVSLDYVISRMIRRFVQQMSIWNSI